MNHISRQSVIWALEELANREEQERLWLSDGSSGEVSSFDEAICNVFDAGVTKELETDRINETVRTLFFRLRTLVKQFDQTSPPNALINDSRMEDVRQIASEILKSLDGKK
jgi:hypothetical protein